MRKIEGKVCVIGETLLPEDKRKSLASELQKKRLRVVEFDEADVFIFVVGSDKGGELRKKAKGLGKYYFSLLPYHDTILGNFMLTIAVLPEHAANWAWSLINTPNKPLRLS